MTFGLFLTGIGLISTFAHAENSDLSHLLTKYSVTNINGDCSVENKNSVIKISNSKAKKPSFERNYTSAQEIRPGVWLATSSDYDGDVHIYFIEQNNGLMVLGTWDDMDGGYSESAFCLLDQK